MRQLAWAWIAVAGMAGVAAASDARHDEKLAMAAARIAAERVGPLRGGFGPGGTAEFVRSEDGQKPTRSRTGPRPGIWVDGLAIAVEKRRSASPEL